MSVFTKESWHPLLCPACENPMLYAANEVMFQEEFDEKGNLNLTRTHLPFYVLCPDCHNKHYEE